MSSDQRQAAAGTAVRLEELPPATGGAGLRGRQVARLRGVRVRAERRAAVLHGRASRDVLVLRLAEAAGRAAHVRDHRREQPVQAVLRPGVRPETEPGSGRAADGADVREDRRDARPARVRRRVRRARRARPGLVDGGQVQPAPDIPVRGVRGQRPGRPFRAVRVRRDRQVSGRRGPRRGRGRAAVRRNNRRGRSRSENRRRAVLRRKRVLEEPALPAVQVFETEKERSAGAEQHKRVRTAGDGPLRGLFRQTDLLDVPDNVRLRR